MRRAYYSSSITDFLNATPNAIIGELTRAHTRDLEQTQLNAWLEQINILKRVLTNREGRIYFEYVIPRMGKRIDVVLLIGPAVFVIEFKVGESHFTLSALDQVTDYCLDLKNFHESSYDCVIAPILIATASRHAYSVVCTTPQNDKLLAPIRSTVPLFGQVIDDVLSFAADEPAIEPEAWERGRYCPTPTIIEAAVALYHGHSVAEISRNDATAINLSRTSESISQIIRRSQEKSEKSICFVTGVPGAGKTLVGLNIATQHRDENDRLYSVFLSGNEPLVAVLREALARDHVYQEKVRAKRISLKEARRDVKAFIQNVHNFRDEYLNDEGAPHEHVTLFDEAQRAWHALKTADFVQRKNQIPDFNQSEPEFLISCLNRHSDWAVIVCLVGGGQEIHRGEAGISEWIESLNRSYRDWHVYISNRLNDTEYGAGKVLRDLDTHPHVTIDENLHLAVSIRSFRAENVSQLVKQLLDLDAVAAQKTLEELNDKYPIVLTRDVGTAKGWLRSKARGTERYGMVVSSQAYRLKPYAIDVKSRIDPIHWFLDPKEDVRSSYYLEDVATQFQVQGLELDWTCVTWDADFRHTPEGWRHWSFTGTRWNQIRALERQIYLKNAYRVLLTRARQGMVIVVPSGDAVDPTRKPDFYDSTFNYLKNVGFTCL